jgi:P27 family predicted phage terminase small subunit
MGNWNSGRRPQPTNLQILRGKKKPSDAVDEPQPAAADESFDVPPEELDENALAQKEWRRVAPMLRLCGMVSEAERSALVSLCQQWAIYLEAQSKVRSLGMIVKKPSGIPTTNPYFAIADRALSHCHRLWTELGLTPSGRTKVSKIPQASKEPASKWAGLL